MLHPQMQIQGERIYCSFPTSSFQVTCCMLVLGVRKFGTFWNQIWFPSADLMSWFLGHGRVPLELARFHTTCSLSSPVMSCAHFAQTCMLHHKIKLNPDIWNNIWLAGFCNKRQMNPNFALPAGMSNAEMLQQRGQKSCKDALMEFSARS